MRAFFRKRGPLFEFASWEICPPNERKEKGILLLTVVCVPVMACDIAMLEKMLTKNPGDPIITYTELMA